MTVRPMPDVDDPVAGPHWRAAADGRLEVQHCPGCDELRWPPAPICPGCLATGGTWTPLSGRGRLWSVAVYRRAFHPGLRDDVPYRVALVELAEGPRLVARVADGVGPGDPVRATFADGLIRFVGEGEPT
jgi:hypothetical protein